MPQHRPTVLSHGRPPQPSRATSGSSCSPRSPPGSRSASLLVLGVFAGGDEPQIIGSALLALGAGFALLAVASTRFTSQPQPWALVPGRRHDARRARRSRPRARRAHARPRGLGLAGAARDAGRLVVPRCAPLARQLVAPCAPLPGARRAAPHRRRRRRRHRHGRDLLEPGSRERPHLPRQRPPSLPQLRRFGLADGRALQRPWRMDAELGMGAGERVGDDARLRVRSRRRRMERRQGHSRRTVTSWRPTCTRSCTPRMSRGRMSLPGTRSAAPTRSSTPRSIRARSPGSR